WPGTAIREWLAGQIARYHHRIGGHLADMDFPRRPVDDLGRRADEDPHRDHRAAADHYPLDHFGAGADETVVLDDHRPRLQRLEYPADADATRDVDVAPDLRARADRHPGIDHGALIDKCAEVDEGRHQDDVARNIGRPPDDRPRYGA